MVSEKEKWHGDRHDVCTWLAMVTCEVHPFKAPLKLISEKAQLCESILFKQDSSRPQSISSHAHLGLKTHSRLAGDICEPSHTDWEEVCPLLCQNEMEAWRWKHFKSPPPPAPPSLLCLNEFQSLASPLKLNMTWFLFCWTDSQSSIFLLWNGRFIIKVNWEGPRL